MTSPPDWLVERAALEEVPEVSRARLERADPRELAERIEALRAENAAELAAHPPGPAVAEISTRLARESKRSAARRRRQRLTWIGAAAGAAAILMAFQLVGGGPDPAEPQRPGPAGAAGEPANTTRVKGEPRLLAFRKAGGQVERLGQNTLVRAGDLIQLRYNAGGQSHGVIASADGAGVVTLHYPASEAAPPEATALSAETTALPHAYALDDAPGFERFFFITSDAPIHVGQTLEALRALARRDDCATASPRLPADFRQWSLLLRKADVQRPETNPETAN